MSYLRQFLNPHMLPDMGDDPGEGLLVSPESLVSGRRFGVTFKHLYAQHYLIGAKSSYPEKQYRTHLSAMTNGSGREEDGSKHCADDFVTAFNSILDSVRSNGFRADRPVPVDGELTAIDGGHRIAAALATNTPVPVVRFRRQAVPYTASMFKDADRAAVEYCKLRPSARIMVLFGENVPQPPSPVYTKRFRLPSATAQDNLITELYLGESWLGHSAQGFTGAAGKARPCFARGDLVTVLIVDMPQSEVIRHKDEIRAATGVRDTVHATDAHAETLRVARVILHDPSIAFLYRPHKHMPRLAALLDEYKSCIGSTDQDLLCVDGSATMAAYGLREPADLDFLHAIPITYSGNVSSHNEYSAFYPIHKDDIIFDPANYFWSRGIKCASLDIVRRVKQVINEPKSLVDLKLMEGL